MFLPGVRVRLATRIPDFNTAVAAEPHVGIEGVVVQESSAPAHHLCVEFDVRDLGYEDQGEGENGVRLYVPMLCLEQVKEEPKFAHGQRVRVNDEVANWKHPTHRRSPRKNDLGIVHLDGEPAPKGFVNVLFKAWDLGNYDLPQEAKVLVPFPVEHLRPALEIEVDFNGHMGFEIGQRVNINDIGEDCDRLAASLEQVYNVLARNANGLDRKAMRDLMKTMPEGEEKERLWELMFDMTMSFDGINCYECGERLEFDLIDGVLVAKTECMYPGGMKPYAVNIAIPSGKIVFANDLRDLVVIDDRASSVNYRRGQRETTENYAKAGMAHICVGNTSPSVYREGAELIVASRFNPYEDVDDDVFDQAAFEEYEKKLEENRLGYICTDLWWISAMDYDWFMERCEAEGKDPKEEDHFVVDVEPGVYAFYDMLADRDAPGDITYVVIKKTDEPAVPIISMESQVADCFLESQMCKSLARDMQQYGRMYPTMFRAIEYTLTVLGNGCRWVHGNLRDVNRPDEPPFKPLKGFEVYGHTKTSVIPIWENMAPGMIENSIYPQSTDVPCPIGRVPLNVDPYWLGAAMILTKTILSNPACIRVDEHHKAGTQEAIFRAILDMLCEIADTRDLWTLLQDDIFPDLTDPAHELHTSKIADEFEDD